MTETQLPVPTSALTETPAAEELAAKIIAGTANQPMAEWIKKGSEGLVKDAANPKTTDVAKTTLARAATEVADNQ